jgi:2-C-methyl-D-erythritol 4-phosphate cytidylyltransferase
MDSRHYAPSADHRRRTVPVSPLPESHSVSPVSAIVLAAGDGRRFGQRKQFVTVGGRRLVDLAIAAVRDVAERVILVVPPSHAWDGTPVDAVVEGGADRGASVRAGLSAIPESEGTVVVHQAANPLASTALCRELLAAMAAGADAAVPALRPADLIRRATGGYLGEVVGRDDLVLVQTPAAFQLSVLREAHARAGAALEDTGLVTSIGRTVRTVPGDPRNVHVATPEDLEIVAALLAAAER